jgi:hypothetical protein
LFFLVLAAAAGGAGPARADPGKGPAGANAPAAHGAARLPTEPLQAYSLSSLAPSSAYWLHLDTDLNVPSRSLDTPWHAIVQPPDRPIDYTLSSAEAPETWGHLGGTPGILELDPEHLLHTDPQRDYRPQLALGGSSESLRSWLREAGINASSCLAPLMRMHSTISGTGPRTNVSISARCNFH